MFANSKLILFSLGIAIIKVDAAPTPRIDGKAPASAGATQEELIQYAHFYNEVFPKIPEGSKVKEFIEAEDVSFYLLSWLREEEMHEVAAEEQLLEQLKWRSDEKIDEIDKGSFTEIKKDLPAFFDTVGKKGQPVLEIWFSLWKLEEYFAGNKHYDMLRYIYYLLEMNNRRIYEDQIKSHGRANDEGDDSIGALMILDVKDIMTDWNDCEDCMDLIQGMFSIIQENYPRSYQNIFIVNAPLQFQITFSSINYNLSRSMNEAIKVFGDDKEEWSSALREKIDKSQRSERFNGEINRGDEYKEHERSTTETWKFEMTTSTTTTAVPTEEHKKSEGSTTEKSEATTTTTEKPKFFTKMRKDKDKKDKKGKDDKESKESKEEFKKVETATKKPKQKAEATPTQKSPKEKSALLTLKLGR